MPSRILSYLKIVQTSEIDKACFGISQRVQHFFAVTQRNKNQQSSIYHRPVCLLTCRLYGRHTCKLYSLIAYKFDKPSYCLPMLWQSLHLQATNKNFGLVFFRTQQGMFSAAPNELSRFKLDVRRNIARYVLSNSKPFGLLPKTLPHSANFSLQSREN